MNKILFLSPYLEPKVWGSSRLASFNIKLPNEPIGEAWIISGYPNKSSTIINGKYAGDKLSDFYKRHRDFFDNCQDIEYPLLMKVLDCNDDLSIQVHPKLSYANEHGVPSKNEAWYVLGSPNNAEIIYGHTAKDKTEFSQMVKNSQWNSLLLHRQVKEGDLINVPAGTIHALTKGLLILEIQQSIDLTYRLYDYGRNNKDRKLHIDESIESSNIPFIKTKVDSQSELHTSFFNIQIINHDGKKRYEFNRAKWIQCFVIQGNGKINGFTKIKRGDSFIMHCKKKSFKLKGKLKLSISYMSV